MAAMIRLRSTGPIELPLSSGQSIRFQIPCEHEFLWDDFLSASPTTLVNRYLADSTQPKVAVADLSPLDLELLLITALDREACQRRLSANLSTDTLCAEFLEALIGISQRLYAERRPQLLLALNAFCKERIDRIDQFIGRNHAERCKISALDLHPRAVEVRRERLSDNIRVLNLKKQHLEEALQQPDLAVGWLAIRELSDPRFTFLDTMTDCTSLDPTYLDYPYRWLGFLSMPVYNQLYQSWRTGNDIVAEIYEELRSTEFEDWLLSFLRQHQITGSREPIICEALWCFRSDRYASTVSLLLPQIEGLLWDLVEYVDATNYPILTPHPGDPPRKAGFYLLDDFGWYMEKQDPILYCEKATNADRGRLDVARDRKRKLLPVERISVLLSKTGLKHYLYRDLFEHLAGELLQERNAILHGENVSFGTREQATRKILATAAVLDLFGKS